MRAHSIVALFVVLCACAGEAERSSATGDTAADSGAAAAEPSTEVVQVTLSEWSIEMLPDSASAGPLTFQVHNRGRTAHALHVTGAGEEWRIDRIAPGGDATLRVDVAAGLYELFCPLADELGSHEARGVNVQLVVE
jgi:hypothetical protein